MGALLSVVYRVLVRVLFPVILALGCSDGSHPTDPAPDAPAFAIADAARGFKQGFYWLPPMVGDPVTSGTFDAELSPVVEICALSGDACDPAPGVIETFTTEGAASTTIRVGADGEHYIVNWHLDEYDLTGSTHYRISVLAGPGVLLGYADVEPVANGGEVKNVDTGEYIGLVDGRTLPIKFRIETGVVAAVSIDPDQATIAPGETQQFTAAVIDLHGNPLAAPVGWTSGDESVASVDGAGAATGQGPGSTTITATADDVSASAVLTVAAAEQSAWAGISAGGDHTCGVTASGDAYCWGRGSSGQLGNGATGDLLTPGAVAGNHVFATVSAGLAHTCGLTTDGVAFCWGFGSFGQLGNGGTDDQVSPVAVDGDHLFASISAGYFHTCAVTSGGDAFCWGLGSTGQLGNGGTDDRLSPTAVGDGHEFTSIAAGAHHTCGVTSGRDALCWGDRFFGALGDGQGSGAGPELLPIAVIGGHRFASVTAGQIHTCGVTTEGAALCWGDGSFGRVGNGGTGIVQTPVAVLGDHPFTSVSAGRVHTCGVTTGGDAFCWGGGGVGSLGYGGTDQQPAPVAVAGDHPFASVSASENFHTCGVTTAGEAYCWGHGISGQLGSGQMVSQSVPVTVLDPF